VSFDTHSLSAGPDLLQFVRNVLGHVILEPHLLRWTTGGIAGRIPAEFAWNPHALVLSANYSYGGNSMGAVEIESRHTRPRRHWDEYIARFKQGELGDAVDWPGDE
jgi:hypothetical protein